MTILALTVLSALLAASAAWIATPAWSHERIETLPTGLRASAASSSTRSSRIMDQVHAARARLLGREGLAHRGRMREIQALTALATELRSGHPPETALRNAGGHPCVWPTAIAAARFGADIADALRIDARAHPSLLPLAACWQVGTFSGSGLALAVEELARSGRASEDTRAQLDAHLASARASIRVLAALPVLGVGMGTVMGATPITWFGSSGIGRAALAGGLVLTGMGLWWARRITRAVERLL